MPNPVTPRCGAAFGTLHVRLEERRTAEGAADAEAQRLLLREAVDERAARRELQRVEQRVAVDARADLQRERLRELHHVLQICAEVVLLVRPSIHAHSIDL